MAIVKFSKRGFERHVKITKEVQEKIPLFGTPLESLGEDEIEIEIFPNRPDLLSLQGYLRSFLAFLGRKPGLKRYIVNKPQKDYTVRIDSSVKNIRPYTACAVVKGIKFDDEKIKEIIDMQEKLHATFGRNRKKAAIGIYPYEKIRMPICYKALKPEKIKFRPLGFPKEISGRQILSQHPAGRDYGYLLEGLEKYPVFIDSNEKVLSMPPIINSYDTGKVTEKTKNVFIECSGSDFNTLDKTLNILVTALADMGGNIYAMRLVYGTKKLITPNIKPGKIKVSILNVNKLLGLNLNEGDIKKLLERMGHSYNKGVVQVAAYRTDVLHEVDIIEDIAIAYGYNNFSPEIPKVMAIGKEDDFEFRKRKVAEILIGLGITEVSTYHLTAKQDIKKTGLKTDSIEVENAKTEYNVLRPALLVSGLKILSENFSARYPLNIFEIGKIFKAKKDIEEATRLAVLLCDAETDYTKIKQVLDYLFSALDTGYEITATEHDSFISGRVGRVVVGKEEVGYIGEIHPKVLDQWGIRVPVAAFELNLADLFEIIETK